MFFVYFSISHTHTKALIQYKNYRVLKSKSLRECINKPISFHTRKVLNNKEDKMESRKKKEIIKYTKTDIVS